MVYAFCGIVSLYNKNNGGPPLDQQGSNEPSPHPPDNSLDNTFDIICLENTFYMFVIMCKIFGIFSIFRVSERNNPFLVRCEALPLILAIQIEFTKCAQHVIWKTLFIYLILKKSAG
jgi:hypothetical protein